MNVQRMTIAMAIGLLISGICTWVLSRKMSAREPEHLLMQSYVVPARTLKAGEVLRVDNIESVNWPAGASIADAFTKPESVIGRVVLYPLAKGQPITEQFLTAVGAGAGLAGKIPNGMRAVALRSDEVVGVAGFLLPDSRVDVLATVHTGKSPEPTTMTVLENVQVLAAGHQIEPDPEGKPASVTVVTLLLNPEEAERAVLASLQGTIHFVLRSGSDKDMPMPHPLDLAQLVGGRSGHSGARVVARAALVSTVQRAPMEVVIETIAGEKQTLDTFRVRGQ